jgi:DNA-binding MarR family transcriptional regulator
MSSGSSWDTLGLREDEAASLGGDGATRIRTFRLLVVLAQELRTLMDHRLRPDGLTTQQAALITIVEALGAPSLSGAASALGTTHQNVKQLVAALERKGFLRIVPDRVDGRVRRLVTTARSREYWRRRSGSDQVLVLEWFADLSEEEARTLFHLLLRLRARTHQALDAGRGTQTRAISP